MEPEPLLARLQQAANNAIAPAVCDVVLVARTPLQVQIRNRPGRPPLTNLQRTNAQAAALAVSPQPRRARPVANIAADIEAWIGTDMPRLRRVASLALALWLRRHPNVFPPTAGDEPDT